MNFPEPPARYPTAEAMASLAKRFDLPNHSNMQDWEYEVADSERIDEFVAAYLSGELDDDERFTLMETILQSFEELETRESDPRWHSLLETIASNLDLHISTVYYWARLDADNPEEMFRISPSMRTQLHISP